MSAKFCVRCGGSLGTRELLHDDIHCESCKTAIANDRTPEPRRGTGLLEFFSEVEKRSPITGRLNLQ